MVESNREYKVCTTRFKSVALVAGFVSACFRGMNLQTDYL